VKIKIGLSDWLGAIVLLSLFCVGQCINIVMTVTVLIIIKAVRGLRRSAAKTGERNVRGDSPRDVRRGTRDYRFMPMRFQTFCHFVSSTTLLFITFFDINCSIWDKETLDHINFTDKNWSSLWKSSEISS